jgi:UDP-N-acetylglucosamine 3-dehydrogenase
MISSDIPANRAAAGAGAGAGTARGARTVRIGIIGCGAIAEGAHLPAVLSSPQVELTALSDLNASRLQWLRRRYHLGPIAFPDYREVVGRVDAVILALPNHLHAPVGMEFLSRGIHVLCEKPLALTRHECEQLCLAARSTSSVLAVGFVARFFPSTELTKRLLESQFLGELQSFEYEFGEPGGWSPFSGYNLARSTCGGGVLVVSGSHALDHMIHLFGDVEVISHADDSRGGIEANCVTWFAATVNGRPVRGRVVLSKTHRLSNRIRIVGERGTLELGGRQTRSVSFLPSRSTVRQELSAAPLPLADAEPNYFQAQLHDFVNAIRTGAAPRVDGEQATKSVLLTERCYGLSTALEEPWCEATLERLARAGQPPAHASAP